MNSAAFLIAILGVAYTATASGMECMFCKDALPACPIAKLTALADRSLQNLRKIEVDDPTTKSTEGAVWDVYLHPDGRPEAIVDTVYGETGREDYRLEMLSADDFVISVNEAYYNLPITTHGGGQTALEARHYIFYCHNIAYAPVALDDRRYYHEPRGEAEETRKMFFDAAELAPYIAKMKR